MDELDIPIFRKTYDLYKALHALRAGVPKQDRHAIWQRCETLVLDLIESILRASQAFKGAKLPILEEASVRVNLLRVLIRLMKDVKTIDQKSYVALEAQVDEIGRMLGGWIRSTKERA